jgi:hypothetical protein
LASRKQPGEATQTKAYRLAGFEPLPRKLESKLMSAGKTLPEMPVPCCPHCSVDLPGLALSQLGRGLFYDSRGVLPWLPKDSRHADGAHGNLRAAADCTA